MRWKECCKEALLVTGVIIEDYPDDAPFPSALFLGWHASDPLHVVAALDTGRETVYIVTAYKPDLAHFMDDFRTRRKREE